MPLAEGARLGPYEIGARLGAGGMGEVYRARDTRLDRAVAIKVLAASLSADPDARARLKREARALSQLSHPNICALYDVGEQDDADYVVMELLEGESLAARLQRGPLALADTIDIGAQIADALDRAHRAGIVHRDLKPGNVMLTAAGAKLVDFGLAKAAMPLASSGSADATTLARSGVTATGTILGTIQYMAPEQIEGLPADARSDIFALGEVLYEMATGRRPFAGTSTAAIAAAILTANPPAVSSLAPTAPPSLDRVIRTCLEKSPEKRWQSAYDVAVLLRALVASTDDGSATIAPQERGAAMRWLPWALAAAAIAIAAAIALKPSPAAAPSAAPVSFSVPPPSGLGFFSSVESNETALSPDGTRIAFIGSSGGVWLRPLSSLTAARVAGAERANSAFWSPDGRSIGFFGSGTLSRIDASGGAVVQLCTVSKFTGYTGTWGQDGIVFGSIGGQAILQVPTAGGTPVELLKPDPARHELRLLWPSFLPDGRRFLYLSWRDDRTAQLMLWEPGKPPREIMPVLSNVAYADPGYLLFVREGTLLAVRFDAATATITGDPVAVAPAVAYAMIPPLGHFSASPNGGVLAYQANANLARVAWFDRSGSELSRLLPDGKYQGLRFSPDGQQVAFERTAAGIGTFDLWTFDLQRAVEARLTSDIGNEIRGLWTADRSAFVYSAGPNGPPRMVVRDMATGAERALHPGAGLQTAEDVTPDGESILYAERANAGGIYRLYLVPLAGGDATPLLEPDVNYGHARFSPDGKWLAYASDEAGELEISVARWPISRERLRVSTGGGFHPRWSRDGRELFYLSDAGLMSVPMTGGQPGKARLLFDSSRAGVWSDFDVARDGRFLAIVSESVGARQPLTVIVNWLATLQGR